MIARQEGRLEAELARAALECERAKCDSERAKRDQEQWATERADFEQQIAALKGAGHAGLCFILGELAHAVSCDISAVPGELEEVRQEQREAAQQRDITSLELSNICRRAVTTEEELGEKHVRGLGWVRWGPSGKCCRERWRN